MGWDEEENKKKEEDPAEKKKTRSAMESGLEAVAMVPQLGLTIAIPIVLGAMGGHWLDEKLGTGMIFSLILLLLGIAGGIASAYKLILAITKKKK